MMRHRTKDEWLRLVRNKPDGMSVIAYCKRSGIKRKDYYKYRSLFSDEEVLKKPEEWWQKK